MSFCEKDDKFCNSTWRLKIYPLDNEKTKEIWDGLFFATIILLTKNQFIIILHSFDYLHTEHNYNSLLMSQIGWNSLKYSYDFSYCSYILLLHKTHTLVRQSSSQMYLENILNIIQNEKEVIMSTSLYFFNTPFHFILGSLQIPERLIFIITL